MTLITESRHLSQLRSVREESKLCPTDSCVFRWSTLLSVTAGDWDTDAHNRPANTHTHTHAWRAHVDATSVSWSTSRSLSRSHTNKHRRIHINHLCSFNLHKIFIYSWFTPVETWGNPEPSGDQNNTYRLDFTHVVGAVHQVHPFCLFF